MPINKQTKKKNPAGFLPRTGQLLWKVCVLVLQIVSTLELFDKGKEVRPYTIVTWGPFSLWSIKEALRRDPVLYTPDFAKTFFLQMDASALALEAVLIQKVERKTRPVAYDSWKLVGPETQYSMIEREYHHMACSFLSLLTVGDEICFSYRQHPLKMAVVNQNWSYTINVIHSCTPTLLFVSRALTLKKWT